MAKKEKSAVEKKRLIGGVFPWLFMANILLVAVFMLMSDDLFLGLVVLFPIGHFLGVIYTIHELRLMPYHERRKYQRNPTAPTAGRASKNNKHIK